jgi:hypothetical protein
VEQLLERMLVEAFRARGEERIQSLQFFTAEHQVERIGCAVAAVTLLSAEARLMNMRKADHPAR